jgi:uracil-DNA glycosylase
MANKAFLTLMKDIRSCDICAYHLSLPPKPIVQLHPKAPLLIIAQAPSTKARATGLPFNDSSGDRLRSWLGIDRETFYDEKKIALMPMGFCYPGVTSGGDLPPCKDCAPFWHPKIFPLLKNIKLTILVGSYAQKYYLNQEPMTKTVKNWRRCLPQFLPLPHSSWHNNAWLKKNPWFEAELLPRLKERIKMII